MSSLEDTEKVIREYDADAMAESIVRCLIEEGVIDRSEGDVLKDIEIEISQLLTEKFPAIAEVAKLRTHYHFKIEGEKPPYSKCGSWEDYLRIHYSEAINRGFLPIPDIKDAFLRRSLSQGQSTNRLPKAISGICKTKQEVLSERRNSIAAILGADGIDKKFRAFVGSLRPQGKRTLPEAIDFTKK